MRRRHNTLSYEEGSQLEAGLGQNDRFKLSQSPLGRYLSVTHLVYGVENELKDFDDRLEKELQKIDHDYRFALDRYYRLKRMYAENLWDENHPTFATMKLVEGQLRQLRDELRPKVTEILFDLYKRALAFVVYYLDDQRLAELRWPTTQKQIAQAIYENLDYYERYYVLGKGVRTMLIEQIEKMGNERGQEVIKNILPGKTEEKKEQDNEADENPISEPTLPGMGRPMQPYIAGPRQSIQRVHQTMRPHFIPQSEAEIRAGAPQDIAMPKENIPRSKTIPYAGQLPPSPSGPETYGYPPQAATPENPQMGYVPTREEIKQTEENAAQMARQVTDVSKLSRLPDLADLFSPDEFVEKSPAFSDIADQVKEEVSEIAQPANNQEGSGAIGSEEVRPEMSEITTPTLPIVEENIEINAPELCTNDNQQSTIIVAPELLETVQAPVAVNQTSQRPSSRPTAPEVPEAKKEVRVYADLQQLNEPLDESEDTVRRKIKRSWGDSIKGAASSAWGWTKRHYKGAILAASIALGITADHTANKYLTDSTEKQPVPVDTSKVTPPPAPIVVTPPKIDQTPAPVVDKTPAPETAKARTFGKIITDSKSPIVQDIINRGETKLGKNTVTDTMIDSFAGLANQEQLKELHELQKFINLGLGVYFNEHFGTPAKVAASLKDPKLRNLYRTAKVAQEKGWFQSYHTKERYPKSYALAVQMLADSSELGLDESANPNKQVQDYVRGNMFQAKLPGNTIKLRKDNGQYHVIQDMVFDIFEGKTVSEMMDSRFDSAGKDGNGTIQAPVKTKAAPKVDDSAPKAPPVLQPDTNKPGQTGQILPNIHQPKGMLGYDQQLMDEVDRGWEDLINTPKKAQNTEEKLVLNKSTAAKPAGAISKFEQEMKEVDDGWEEIGKNLDKLQAEKMSFEKTARVEFDLPLYFTTRQENDAIIPNVADKMAALYPQADGAAIKKMIRQYGWIGMKLISRGRGHFVVELNGNFYKNILRPILQKKAPTRLV